MRPGERIGPFELVSLIDQGGQGEVWRASAPDGTPVAVKVLRSDRPGSDASDTDRLRHEVRALRTLTHPGIVRLIDCIEHAGGLAVVMELAEGESMATWLERGQPLADRLQVMGQIVDAVAHAHDHGIAHRDLKPRNVVVAPGPAARVVDFGLARGDDWTRLTGTGDAIGSLPWMAPERLKRIRHDPPADVYSLGMMLASCLDVRTMNDLADPDRFHAWRRARSPVPLPALPQRVRSILSRAMARDPERRGSARELLAEIETLAGDPVALDDDLEAATAASANPERRLEDVERPELAHLVEHVASRLSAGTGLVALLMSPPGGGRSWALRRTVSLMTQAGFTVRALQGLHLRKDTGALASAPTQPLAAVGWSEGLPALVAEIEHHAATGALVIELDDLEAAPATTWEAVERIADLAASRPIAMLLAADGAPESAGRQRDRALAAVLRRLLALPCAEPRTIAPLDVRRLGQALVRTCPNLDPVDASSIAQWSGGVPGVAEALLARWSRRGAIGQLIDDEDDPLAGSMEESLVASAARRWQALDDASRRVARAVIAAGGSATTDAIVVATSLDRLVVRSRVTEMAERHGWFDAGVEIRLIHPFLPAAIRKAESDGGW